MERLSSTLKRQASELEPQDDGFPDTVPGVLHERLLSEGGLEFPAHWGLPSKSGRQPHSARLEHQSGFQDTVPYELPDEEPDTSGPRAGVAGRLEPPGLPANFRRQALGIDRTPGAGLATYAESGAQTNRERSAVSSKGGRVSPAHWALSPDVGEQAAEVALPHLRMVGIGDLKQVSSHITSRALGATRHIVRFHNGGFVRFAYGVDGSVVELSGERITVRIGVQGDVLITAHLPNGTSS